MGVELQVQKNLIPQMLAEMESKRQEIAARFAEEAAQETRLNIQLMGAVDSGELLESVEGQVLPDGTALVVVGAPHAAAVHWGHHTRNGGFVSGRAFLSQAMATMGQRVPGIVREVLND